MINKGFKTTVVPIINGEKVYAIVKITAPVVFRNMFAILTVSILIFFFIIACMIYEIKIFLNQHYINQLRENFTHALTHDMKTPLAATHSVLIQLENGTLNKNPDLRQRFISIAIEQTLNLQAIVNRILTLTYIESKQLIINKQSIDLQEIIQRLIDKFTVKSNKKIGFQTFYDFKDRVVYADPFYLDNAISNLIDNAIKYSGESVKIDIECTIEEKYIHIRVKDNGFGISSNDQLRIFKRFERGAEIKRNQISGFGIGLNYVQQVIEAHEGNVTVLSQEGVGSEFIITLPA
jgi:two-component system phosphate regulon sensor histidine kinase PhoR